MANVTLATPLTGRAAASFNVPLNCTRRGTVSCAATADACCAPAACTYSEGFNITTIRIAALIIASHVFMKLLLSVLGAAWASLDRAHPSKNFSGRPESRLRSLTVWRRMAQVLSVQATAH